MDWDDEDNDFGLNNAFVRRDLLAWDSKRKRVVQKRRVKAKPSPSSTKSDTKSTKRAVTAPTKPDQAFRFLDLPSELRLYFYKHHLLHHRGFVRLFDRYCPRLRKPTPANLGVNLLLTCRQIHDEAVEILYGHNVFLVLPTSNPKVYWQTRECFEMTEPKMAPSDALIHNMGARNLSMIRKVEIQLSNPVEHVASEFTPMKELLPNLQSTVYFFDWWTVYVSSSDNWFAHKLLEHHLVDDDLQLWYRKFFEKMPKSASVAFDVKHFVLHEAIGPHDKPCYCPKGLLRAALEKEFPAGLPLTKNQGLYWQKQEQDIAAYQAIDDRKGLRLVALGYGEEFVEGSYASETVRDLRNGNWDNESVVDDSDVDSVAALEEEYPGIYDGSDRESDEDDREYMERKVDQLLLAPDDEDAEDDESIPDLADINSEDDWQADDDDDLGSNVPSLD